MLSVAVSQWPFCATLLPKSVQCQAYRARLARRHSSPLLKWRDWPQARRNLSILEHIHLRGDGETGLIPYEQAEAAQEAHRAQFLTWKGTAIANKHTSPSSVPKPRLISFEALPTYTLGRRQENLAPEQMNRLQRPLDVSLTRGQTCLEKSFRPAIRHTSRGGLTTYHGPGQIVLWPVIDMHSSLYPKYGVASYANHLETTTQRLLSDCFGIQTYVERDEPGVWVVQHGGGPPRKMAALGVHHRRYVTALGTAVNIHVPVTGAEASNPWARFVPCGLDGKLVTSVAAELAGSAPTEWNLEDLARRWAVIFEEGLLDESKRKFSVGADARLR